MFKLHTLLILLTMGLSANGFAQVYEATDSEGNPSFSDTPSAGSEEIELPETNVGDSVKVPEPSAEPAPKPEVVEQSAPPLEAVEAVEGDYNNGSGNYRRRHHRRHGHGR